MVLRAHTQTIAQFSQGFWPPCIFWTPAKCEVAHTSFPFSPSKVQHRDIYLAPGGVHGTETKTSHRIYRRDGSCDSVDHPGGHDVGGGCAELVSDLPPSTFAFVLRRSTSFLPPTLDTRRRVAAISAGSVALPRPRP